MGEMLKCPVEVVLMAEEHVGSLAEFFQVVGWDAEATPEKIRRGWKATSEGSPFFPGQDVPTVLLISERRVLGYVSSIPVALWTGAEEHRAEWIKGLMVHPDHRNGPIGFLLVKELLQRLVCPLSLTVSNASRRLFEALGMANLGMVPNYLRLLNSGTVLRKLDVKALGMPRIPGSIIGTIRFCQRVGLAPLLGSCLDSAMQLKVMCSSLSTRSLEVEFPKSLPNSSELDDLWRAVRGQLVAAPVRNARYLRWRYGDTVVYRSVTVRQRGKLAAFAVVRRARDRGDPRLRGIRMAALSDLVFPPDRPELAVAALKGAEEVARNLESDALLCSATHPAVLTALRRQGYLRIPANLHFLVANPRGNDSLPRDLSAWWLTRGDMNADEVF